MKRGIVVTYFNDCMVSKHVGGAIAAFTCHEAKKILTLLRGEKRKKRHVSFNR